MKLHVVPPGGEIDLKPFALRFIRMAHSIPEAQALAIDTPYGIVLHTGDWKLDPTPLIGPPTDEAALAALAKKPVLAMVCDSTNAMVEGHSGSEQDVQPGPDRADPRPARPRRGDLLRQQRRAHGSDRARGARRPAAAWLWSAAACATWTPPRANAAT